jgi:hypothetical protein
MPELAALIAVLIIERPLCVECVAERAGVSVGSVKAYLNDMGPLLKVHRKANERCRACGLVGRTVSLDRVGDEPSADTRP